ncbi:MAG: VacJ family lipoprotein [Porticoccaceae bacterium]|nr:VacJ family lipoprotein [Porticoccaceae bacterium]
MKDTKLLLTSVLTFMLATSAFAEEEQTNDSFEGLNRKAFVFNETLDNALLKPVAKTYAAVIPDPLERGILNVFSNLNEVTNILNDLLQAKFAHAGHDSGRFLINTTIGVGGLFDVAQRAGLEKSEGEDFGQTLANWGVSEGPYLMLPFVGPSTLRDAPSKIIDSFANPVAYMDHVSTRNSVRALDLLAMRADLLALDDVISGDRYLFVRDVYLQRREYLVSDGAIEDDFGDLDDY